MPRMLLFLALLVAPSMAKAEPPPAIAPGTASSVQLQPVAIYDANGNVVSLFGGSGGGGGGATGSVTAPGTNGMAAQAVQGITGGINIGVSALSWPLPTGAATSALQASGNASLSSIDAKTPALSNGKQPVEATIINPSVAGSEEQDVRSTGTLNAATLNIAIIYPINGQSTVGLTFTGLTASGATVTFEQSNDGGTTWTGVNEVNAGTGVASATRNADGQTRVAVQGRTNLRIRVSTTGAGTITVASNISVREGLVTLASPLPPGANNVGTFGLSGPIPAGTNAIGSVLADLRVAGAPNAAGNPIFAQVTNFPAIQTIAGTVTQGAAATDTSANRWPVLAYQGGLWSVGISGTLPAFAATPTFKTDLTTPGTTNKVSLGPDVINQNLTQIAGTTLGAPTGYGTAPTGIVPGVNANVTNFPAQPTPQTAGSPATGTGLRAMANDGAAMRDIRTTTTGALEPPTAASGKVTKTVTALAASTSTAIAAANAGRVALGIQCATGAVSVDETGAALTAAAVGNGTLFIPAGTAPYFTPPIATLTALTAYTATAQTCVVTEYLR